MAARLAVRWTPRDRGRTSKLVVSIRISAGVHGVGAPLGKTWPRGAEGWFCRPVRRVASQSGKARAVFIDSWIVGLSV